MKLRARHSDVTASEPVVMMNIDDCLKLGVDSSDRVRITGRSSVVCAVTVSGSVIPKGTVAIPTYVLGRCGASDGEEVEVTYSPLPESVRSIKKKINGLVLTDEEVTSIVDDIMEGNLSETEIIAFVSALNVNNSEIHEVAALTRAMAATGRKVDFGMTQIYYFRRLGGISGNEITPFVVSIVAAEGLHIPKMSSRAISSACATADFVSTFCEVELDADTLVVAVGKANGVFACGNEDYAPVGRIIIRAERTMGIDPRPVMMASILSKKVAVGTTHLVMDIPVGGASKISTLAEAREFSELLIGLGESLGIRVDCVLSHACEPLGTAVGPILEARECISALEKGEGNPAFIDKSCSMAGAILVQSGISDGKSRALEVLRSGRAHAKFLEIVELQKGDPGLRSSDLVPGKYWKDIHAKRDGYVQHIDNASIIAIAKAAGSPSDPGAGILFHHKTGDVVKEGEALFRVYAESESKLERAVGSARSRRPMVVDAKFAGKCPEDTVIETFGL